MSDQERANRTVSGPLPPLESGELEDDQDLAGPEGADPSHEAAAGSTSQPASESDAAGDTMPDQTGAVERGLTRLPPG
jgi:hypothetical protein